MANALYTLAEGEQVQYELKTDVVVKEDLGAAAKFAGMAMLGKCCLKTPGVFVVTNKRIIVTYVTTTGILCFKKEKAKVFECYQRKALNGYAAYDRLGNGKKKCCSRDAYLFTVGIDEGNVSARYKITTKSVRSEEEAQAIVASLSTLA